MAYEIPVQLIPLTAGEDLSDAQFRALKLDSNGNVVKAGAATDIVVGILQDKPGQGQAANVMTFGISKVVASGAISIGALLTASTGGKAAAAADGDRAFGIALESTSGADQVFAALIMPGLAKK